MRLSRSALDHALSDGDHQVRTLSAKVADDDALDTLDVNSGVPDGAPAATTGQ